MEKRDLRNYSNKRLLQLLLEKYAQTSHNPHNREMHEWAFEVKDEMERRIDAMGDFESICNEFNERVDRGEVRSKKTYAKIKAAQINLRGE